MRIIFDIIIKPSNNNNGGGGFGEGIIAIITALASLMIAMSEVGLLPNKPDTTLLEVKPTPINLAIPTMLAD